MAMSGKDGTAFLVGAGRSGTTLVYKLLCLHRHVAYISNYDEWRLPLGRVAGLVSGDTEGKLAAWFSGGGNAYFVKRPFMKRVFPTPVEGESIYRRCGIPLFPDRGYVPSAQASSRLRRAFSSIRRGAHGDIVLSKRTSNNRRISALNKVFPNARYIHVIRDGREVADSLLRVEWWGGHRVWWDGRTAEEMERSGEDSLTIAARNWVYEMQELNHGLSSIAAQRILEVRYENLLADPERCLVDILGFIGIEADAEYLKAIRSLKLHYRPGSWQRRWSEAQLATVLQEQSALLNGLGYR
ncbi:MAG: sulfotransferase [Chromatiales bacterium]|jgi:hypothetical protein|nr:sulfotransferase [Chromatiales bacterium]